MIPIHPCNSISNMSCFLMLEARKTADGEGVIKKFINELKIRG